MEMIFLLKHDAVRTLVGNLVPCYRGNGFLKLMKAHRSGCSGVTLALGGNFAPPLDHSVPPTEVFHFSTFLFLGDLFI